MAQIKPQWEPLVQFSVMAAKLIEKYPERYLGVEIDKLIAYSCTNKDKPKGGTKPYEMSGESEPESFTNSKQYFVKLFQSDWDSRTEQQQLAIVASVLERIDPDDPGKIKPLDHRDQGVMLRTFGIDWHDRGDLPHLLNDNVQFRE
jgi:hypothetical protein